LHHELCTALALQARQPTWQIRSQDPGESIKRSNAEVGADAEAQVKASSSISRDADRHLRQHLAGWPSKFSRLQARAPRSMASVIDPQGLHARALASCKAQGGKARKLQLGASISN
jgi:hypothetical protein